MAGTAELGTKNGWNGRIRDKKLLDGRIRDNFFSTTFRCLLSKIRILIKENTIVLNLWIMIELDLLYKKA